jgi:hypothetical protein
MGSIIAPAATSPVRSAPISVASPVIVATPAPGTTVNAAGVLIPPEHLAGGLAIITRPTHLERAAPKSLRIELRLRILCISDVIELHEAKALKPPACIHVELVWYMQELFCSSVDMHGQQP